jgi:DNA-binding NtrC family response regulator
MTRLEPAVEEVFRRYSWPGNVRELSNLLERIFILEDGDTIRVAHIPARILREVQAGGPAAEQEPGQGFAAATDQFQRDLIRRALDAAGGSRSRAAQRLGLSRHALRHQMLKLGMA